MRYFLGLFLVHKNSVVRQLYWWTSRVVDPVLNPIRNALGPMTRNLGIDISPFVLIILLQFFEAYALVIDG